MARGGARPGSGRPKGTEAKFSGKMREQLREFNDRMNGEADLPGSVNRLMRPEEIILRVANGLKAPGNKEFTPIQFQAAVALLPYSIAKPASVSIHHVQRTDIRQYTDEELERIANTGSGGGGTFTASESPLLTLDMVRDRSSPDGDEAGEASPAADDRVATFVGDAER
jgi:hypothetical protein